MTRNVVVIVLDTTRWRDVVPATRDGQPVAPTVASIGAEGVRYDSAFTPAPWTLPSHASLFTGTYPSTHGAHAAHEHLDRDVPVVTEAFQRAGYETVAVSNNTWVSEEFGFGRGFDTFHRNWQYVQTDTDLESIVRNEEGIERIRSLVPKLFEGNPLVNLANVAYGQFVANGSDKGARHTNEWICDWLGAREGDRPFFLFANYLEPHLEYRPPAEYARPFLPADATYEAAMAVPQEPWAYLAGETEISDEEFDLLRALYRGEIAYLDDRIGDLRSILRDHGAWEESVVVLAGDHGENVGDHGFMDHQYNLYDTLLHVPLVVRGGPFARGGVDDRLVSLTDLAPTLLDVAGLDAPELRERIQGRSLLSDDGHDHVFAEYAGPQPSMAALEKRLGPLPPEMDRYDRSLRAVRTTDWKLIVGSDDGRECFRMRDDPAETVPRDGEPCGTLEGILEAWISPFEQAEATGQVSMSADARDRLEELGYLQE
jgi:arylsulfatase A-like enzyme